MLHRESLKPLNSIVGSTIRPLLSLKECSDLMFSEGSIFWQRYSLCLMCLFFMSLFFQLKEIGHAHKQQVLI